MELQDKNINIPKKIREMSFHNFIGFCSVLLLILIDSFFLGLQSEVELAAAMFASPLIFFFVNIFLGASNAKMIFISKNINLEKEELRKKSNYIDLISLSIYILLFSFLAVNLSYILDFFDVDAEIKSISEYYILIHYFGAFFCVYNNLASSYLKGLGDTRLPAKLMMATALINLILDPIFIFYFDLGASGAAIATTLAWLFVSIYMTYILIIKNKLTMKIQKFELNSFLITLPSFIVNQLLNPLTIMMVFYFITQFGIAAISGIGMGIRLEKFIVILGFAFGASLSVFSGHNINDKNRSLFALKTTLYQSVGMAFVFSLVLFLLSDFISLVFNLNKDASEVLKTFFIFNIPTSIFTITYVIISSYLNASNKHNIVLKSNLIRTIVVFPTMLSIFVFYFQLQGILISLFIYSIFSILILFLLIDKKDRSDFLKINKIKE